MATKHIHRGVGGGSGAAGNGAGLEVDITGALVVDKGADFKSALATAPGYELVPVDRFIEATGNITLSAADHGATILANSAATVVVTLPSTRKGLRFKLVVGQLPASGVGTSFSPAAADQIIGNGLTPADNKDALCAVAGDVIGDFMELTGDGNLGWYITGVKGTWTREA